MKQTLGKTEKLRKRDFHSAKWIKSGRSPHFLLFQSHNEDSSRRFGVVVSRKIKGAVTRNRIKRLLREFFRLNKALFRECTSHSIRVTRLPEHLTWCTISPELHGLVLRAANK